jgi:hypothetical protein
MLCLSSALEDLLTAIVGKDKCHYYIIFPDGLETRQVEKQSAP